MREKKRWSVIVIPIRLLPCVRPVSIGKPSKVKTGSVRLGHGVTIGVGSVVEIGVAIGDGTQIGALSFVPKHTVLDPGSVYAGVPVRRIAHRSTTA